MARREADGYEDEYDARYDDAYDDAYVRWAEPEPAVRRPWHRNPIFLLGLIAAASVALAVAAVLLLTSDRAENSPAKLKPTIRTTAVVIPPSASASETSAAETTTDTSAEATTSETESPESEIPAATAESPAPMPSARDSGSEESDGPRINVTRSPMSFTPGA